MKGKERGRHQEREGWRKSLVRAALAGTIAWACTSHSAQGGVYGDATRAGWEAWESGKMEVCAHAFANATHAAVAEKKGRQSTARAAYWAAQCAEKASVGGAGEWRRWIVRKIPESFHAQLLASETTQDRRAQTPTWRHWVESIIDVESRWRTRARSPKGAIGLMQVMPDTARNLLPRKTGRETLMRCLYDARCNRMLGERYLAKQLQDNEGDWVAALIAYNAGPKRARRWRRERNEREPIEAIDRIRIAETRDYVGKVLTRLWTRTHVNGHACATWTALKEGRWPTAENR